jgi:hypothetical protein
MASKNNVKYLSKIAEAACKDPFFIGKALSDFGVFKKMDHHALAKWLKCDLTDLTRLTLCRMPNDENDRFQSDVRKIAEFASCDANQLVQLLREINGIKAFRSTTNNNSLNGLLMAARDRKSEREKENHPKKHPKS